jgi:hypothetical protein
VARPSRGQARTTRPASALRSGAPSKASTDYFAPSEAPFMINYRVPDLRALLAVLRSEGCQVDDKVEESEFGLFGWVMDP